MNENLLYYWFALGFLPYHVVYRRLPGGTRLIEIRAIFWRLTIRRPPGGPGSGQLHITLIERMRAVIWSALDQLLKR